VTALILGTVIALLALAFVLYPLFSDVLASRAPELPPREPPAAERAVAALREVEFDRHTGKLSDSDYATLKATYTREALAAIRAEQATAEQATNTAVNDDEVEATILRYRAPRRECPSCGPRPEPDAVYCSNCGYYLAGKCGRCGADVSEVGARFCAACGAGLAA
jgi:Double zinc ribbon